MDDCVFCDDSLSDGQPTSKLRKKGCDGIKDAATSHESEKPVVPGQLVHVNCRKEYTKDQSIEAHKRKHPKKDVTSHCTTRSGESEFIYEKHCLFCGLPEFHAGKKTEYKHQ